MNYTGVRKTFSQLWCQEGDLKVVELDYSFFQFIFSKKEENERVMMKRLCFFKNQMLILQEWKMDLKSGDDCF